MTLLAAELEDLGLEILLMWGGGASVMLASTTRTNQLVSYGYQLPHNTILPRRRGSAGEVFSLTLQQVEGVSQ